MSRSSLNELLLSYSPTITNFSTPITLQFIKLSSVRHFYSSPAVLTVQKEFRPTRSHFLNLFASRVESWNTKNPSNPTSALPLKTKQMRNADEQGVQGASRYTKFTQSTPWTRFKWVILSIVTTKKKPLNELLAPQKMHERQYLQTHLREIIAKYYQCTWQNHTRTRHWILCTIPKSRCIVFEKLTADLKISCFTNNPFS